MAGSQSMVCTSYVNRPEFMCKNNSFTWTFLDYITGQPTTATAGSQNVVRGALGVQPCTWAIVCVQK